MAADLEIRIGAELTEIKGALASLQRDLSGVGNAAQAAGRNSLQGLEAGARSALVAVQGLVAAFAGLQVAGTFIRLADEAQNLNGRLRLVTQSQQEFNQALQGVQQVARTTRQPLSAVADVYTRLAQNIQDTPARLLALTETISKTIALSGTSAQAGQAALVQFAQGLSAGALRGEEFNSVAEQAPRLLRVLQDGLGKTRGELRELADQGKLTSDLIQRALQNQADTINREFATLPTTIGQSFTLLQNAALQYVGVLDEANGISVTFANSVKTLADNFQLLAAAITAVVGIPLAVALGRAAAALGALTKGLTAAAGAAALFRGAIGFLGGPIGAALTALTLAGSAFLAFGTKATEANKQATDSTKQSTEEIIASIQKQIDKIEERNKALAQGDGPVDAGPSQAQQQLAAAEGNYREALQRIGTATTEAQRVTYQELARVAGEAYGRIFAQVGRLNAAQAETNRLTQQAARTRYLQEYATDAEKLAQALEKAKKELGAQFTPDIERRIRARFTKKEDGPERVRAAQIEAEEKLAEDAARRRLAILEREFDEGKVAVADYYAEREVIEIGALDAAIARERERAKAGAPERAKALAEIEILERRKEEVRDRLIRQTSSPAQLQAQEQLARDSADRQLANLQRQFDEARISSDEYYRERTRIELESLDRSIAIERDRAKAGGAEQTKALSEIEILERRKNDIQAQNARERAALARELDNQLAQARATELEGRGQQAEAARIRLEAQYRDVLTRLQAEGKVAGVNLIRNLIDTGVARARFDELRQRADALFADLERRRQEIQNRVRTGEITGAQGQQEERTAIREAGGQIEYVNGQLRDLATQLKDPALIAAADQVGVALKNMTDQARPPLEQFKEELRASLADMQNNIERVVASAGVDALTNLFTDLASGTKTAGDALKDFVRGFIQSMAQIAARALATYAVLTLLDAIYPGLGKATAATMGATARVQHGGGMAGTGPIRRVDPLLFLGAPRYHGGGMVGLKPDERPAILQTGEEVLSRSDPRNQANGGGGVRVINVIDPSLVSDYMTSSAGEKSILNILQRNPSAVRQVLA